MNQLKPTLPFLETMIIQACNLSCTGCTNYSDLRHSGYVTWQQGHDDLSAWLERIDIQEFGIMGGEPMINPQWRDWVIGTRELFPQNQLRFTTNGLLIKDVRDIVDVMKQVGNIVFKITVHVDSDRLNGIIDQVFACEDWQPIQEYGINRWIGPNQVRFQINRPELFTKSFQGTYTEMRPWHSEPRLAFKACCQQTCPLLYNGRIYKCSTAGLIQDTLDRFDRPNWEEWQPYIDKGIGIDSSTEEIERFCRSFGKPESICGQCPVPGQSDLNHRRTVKFK